MIICLGPICFPVWHLIPVLFLLWARVKVRCRSPAAPSLCRKHVHIGLALRLGVQRCTHARPT